MKLGDFSNIAFSIHIKVIYHYKCAVTGSKTANLLTTLGK